MVVLEAKADAKRLSTETELCQLSLPWLTLPRVKTKMKKMSHAMVVLEAKADVKRLSTETELCQLSLPWLTLPRVKTKMKKVSHAMVVLEAKADAKRLSTETELCQLSLPWLTPLVRVRSTSMRINTSRSLRSHPRKITRKRIRSSTRN